MEAAIPIWVIWPGKYMQYEDIKISKLVFRTVITACLDCHKHINVLHD